MSFFSFQSVLAFLILDYFLIDDCFQCTDDELNIRRNTSSGDCSSWEDTLHLQIAICKSCVEKLTRNDIGGLELQNIGNLIRKNIGNLIRKKIGDLIRNNIGDLIRKNIGDLEI